MNLGTSVRQIPARNGAEMTASFLNTVSLQTPMKIASKRQ
jgi:hypothetical protein